MLKFGDPLFFTSGPDNFSLEQQQQQQQWERDLGSDISSSLWPHGL